MLLPRGGNAFSVHATGQRGDNLDDHILISMAGDIVSWVCKRMGYEEELLRQRVSASWFVLFVAFPVHWITILVLV